MTLSKRAITFGYTSVGEMLEKRRDMDSKRKKISYWKKHYNLEITEEQYDMFSKHSTNIKKILPILDFVKTLNLIE